MLGWSSQDFVLVRLEPFVKWRLKTELVVVLLQVLVL